MHIRDRKILLSLYSFLCFAVSYSFSFFFLSMLAHFCFCLLCFSFRSSVAELLAKEHPNPSLSTPTHFIVHTWEYLFMDTMNALLDSFEESPGIYHLLLHITSLQFSIHTFIHPMSISLSSCTLTFVKILLYGLIFSL